MKEEIDLQLRCDRQQMHEEIGKVADNTKQLESKPVTVAREEISKDITQLTTGKDILISIRWGSETS